ncbi:MAG: c-type cytochrome [Mangrovicoccus sp.]|nr:c-type cytochrome [Mangrovicoccus sp.]
MARMILMAGIAAIAAIGGIIFWSQTGPAEHVPAPTAAQISYADEAMPSDAALAAIYDRSCRACHALEGFGAPLTGHSADWQARLDARGGMQALLISARDGYQDMPAKGLCNDCSDAQFLQLIEFMIEEVS